MYWRPTPTDIRIRPGESLGILLSFFDDEGEPLDVSSSKIYMGISILNSPRLKASTEPSGDELKLIRLVNNNEVAINILPEQTKRFPPAPAAINVSITGDVTYADWKNVFIVVASNMTELI